MKLDCTRSSRSKSSCVQSQIKSGQTTLQNWIKKATSDLMAQTCENETTIATSLVRGEKKPGYQIESAEERVWGETLFCGSLFSVGSDGGSPKKPVVPMLSDHNQWWCCGIFRTWRCLEVAVTAGGPLPTFGESRHSKLSIFGHLDCCFVIFYYSRAIEEPTKTCWTINDDVPEATWSF